MSSLPAHSSIRDLGRILRAAVAFGFGSLERNAVSRGAEDTGSSPAPASADHSSTPPDFEGDALALFRLLHDRRIPHLLVGGIALLRYVQGRNTDDIDLILDPADLARLPELNLSDRNSDFAHARFGALRIDLLLTANPIFALALERHATAHHFAELSVPCATPAGLILLKLYALPSLYRQRDLARAALYENDMLMLLQHERIDTAPLLTALKPHLDPASLAEPQTILNEITARLARMNRQ